MRKSSGGMDERFSEDIDLAAERSALKEAVRFDLNTDFRGRRGKAKSLKESSDWVSD